MWASGQRMWTGRRPLGKPAASPLPASGTDVVPSRTLLCARLRAAGVDPGWLYRAEQGRTRRVAGVDARRPLSGSVGCRGPGPSILTRRRTCPHPSHESLPSSRRDDPRRRRKSSPLGVARDHFRPFAQPSRVVGTPSYREWWGGTVSVGRSMPRPMSTDTTPRRLGPSVVSACRRR